MRWQHVPNLVDHNVQFEYMASSSPCGWQNEAGSGRRLMIPPHDPITLNLTLILIVILCSSFRYRLYRGS